MSWAAGTKYRSQVTGHKTFKKKVSGYVTIRHMFGIDHAFRFCSDSKTTKWQKLHVVLEIEEFLFPFVSLEISKQGFVFAPREETWWNEALRGEWNGKISLLTS